LFFGHAVESTAGGSENQALDLSPVPTAHEALEDGGMLGIHGNDLGTVQLCLGHDKFTAADQCFFIGKTDPLSRADGGKVVWFG
jgi:hypothetical protein